MHYAVYKKKIFSYSCSFVPFDGKETCFMHARSRSQLLTLLALGMVFALAGCAAGGTASPGNNAADVATATPSPTPTDTPTPTPTPTPPTCGANFTTPPVYVSTLPDASFNATNVYAQVQLPPLTRSYDDDAAGGVRGRVMCSAGTTDAVQNFMSQHLTQLGWQQSDTTGDGCLSAAAEYGHPQCWKNGTYLLFVGINSNTDWIILFRDPDFM
jgi:hypothetical protein